MHNTVDWLIILSRLPTGFPEEPKIIKISPEKSGHFNDWLRSHGPIPFLVSEPCRRAMLLEALPAVYRAALGGLERHLAILAAVRALCLMHLSGATKAPASPSVFVSHIIHSLFPDFALENRVRFCRYSCGLRCCRTIFIDGLSGSVSFS